MPFGLTNASATFQAYINEALVGLFDVICVIYIDDILIYNNSAEKHEEQVRKILIKFRNYNLYVKLSKYKFSIIEIEFLKYIIGTVDVSIDPRRIIIIKKWKKPASYHKLQIFLGFANFYRRFIF